MGSSQSNSGLTQDLLEDYTTLTYLGKGEILHLWKKFKSIDPEKIEADYHHRFNKEDLMSKFGALRINPFNDRIFQVFSSKQDDCFSFEDLLDLCSVMSADCSPEVKAAWAFKIFACEKDTYQATELVFSVANEMWVSHKDTHLDEDNQISERDVSEILDRLIAFAPATGDRCLDDDSKKKIAKVIVQEINLDDSGSIGSNEFQYIMARLPEFETSFYFRL